MESDPEIDQEETKFWSTDNTRDDIQFAGILIGWVYQQHEFKVWLAEREDTPLADINVLLLEKKQLVDNIDKWSRRAGTIISVGGEIIISITNEGADWALTIKDISQGEYMAAIGFLPLVPGSAALIGGDPGIGKSTLLLQAVCALSNRNVRCVYVSGEESVDQVRMRAQRMGLEESPVEMASATNVRDILASVEDTKDGKSVQLLIIDSIQTMYIDNVESAPGTVTQVRTCAQEIIRHAKARNIAVIFVGHVTKDGQIAGPRVLEHMVDTVLYFEGDRYHSHRVVRAIKNRFGTTLEVGLFEMTDGGLKEVEDGRGLLANEYQSRAGSVVCPILQGTRCLLVEMQALTATGFLGSAKRKVSGLDSSRLAMLIAVLEKHAALRLADQDIFASAVGGMKVAEPAADLGLALAIAGSLLNRTLEPGVCAIGEIGLGGEVRHVQQMEQRIREAARLGFTRILAPKTPAKPPKGAKVTSIQTVGQALEHLG